MALSQKYIRPKLLKKKSKSMSISSLDQNYLVLFVIRYPVVKFSSENGEFGSQYIEGLLVK